MMTNGLKTSRSLPRLVGAAMLAFGAFHSPLRADSTVEFVAADDHSRARGVVGYVVADAGGGEVTTFILAESSDIVTSTQSTGCIEFHATTSISELLLRFTENNTAQFIQNDVIIAEIAPDGAGGWNHWGTEALAGSRAFDALAVVTGDSNLMVLDTANCAPAKGYWDCVLKVLECEGYTALCVTAGLLPGECAEPCAVPDSPDCISCLNGLDSNTSDAKINPCKMAKTCWQEAAWEGCVPW